MNLCVILSRKLPAERIVQESRVDRLLEGVQSLGQLSLLSYPFLALDDEAKGF